MRQASKTLLVVAAGWVVVTTMSALFVFGSSGTLWLASHDSAIGSVVWPMFGVVLVAGVALLFAVHAYVSLRLGDGVEEA